MIWPAKLSTKIHFSREQLRNIPVQSVNFAALWSQAKRLFKVRTKPDIEL